MQVKFMNKKIYLERNVIQYLEEGSTCLTRPGTSESNIETGDFRAEDGEERLSSLLR